MPHTFNPKRAKHLNSFIRRLLFPPHTILKKIGLKPDDILLDVGAGIGFFSIPAACVLTHGKVIAIDTQEQMIQLLSQKIKQKDIQNIQTFVSRESEIPIPEESATCALLSFVLHEVENKQAMMNNIYHALRKEGKLAIIEFNETTLWGPPKHERIKQAQIKQLLTEAGFSQIAIQKLNFLSFLVIAKKM